MRPLLPDSHAGPAGEGGCPAVEVRDLSFAYPNGHQALCGVSFTVKTGESVAIIGENGAGKSTLLLHLNGILRGEGSVRILGIEVADHTLREIRRLVGVVFQDPEDQLFLNTVAQDVAFGPSNMGLSRIEVDERVREALTSMGMLAFADRSAHLLSFGEKKRIATATVLAMRPEILVLDEPTSNLDPRARRQLIEILNELPVTKIVVTHDLPVACEMCSRALVLAQGRVVADGPIENVLTDEELLEAAGLELPRGFALEALSRTGDGPRS